MMPIPMEFLPTSVLVHSNPLIGRAAISWGGLPTGPCICNQFLTDFISPNGTWK